MQREFAKTTGFFTRGHQLMNVILRQNRAKFPIKLDSKALLEELVSYEEIPFVFL